MRGTYIKLNMYLLFV